MEKIQESGEYYLKLAKRTLKQTTAHEYLKKAVSLDPSLWKAWLMKGLSEAGLKDYAEAEKSFEKLIELQPDNLESWEHKSMFYTESLHNPEKSITLWKRCVERNPTNIEALRWIADVHHDSKNFAEALNYYDKILEIDPKNKWAVKNKKKCLKKLK